MDMDSSAESHPIRVRGLKLPEVELGMIGLIVAPYTGAWIETLITSKYKDKIEQSHPIRVRGLKPAINMVFNLIYKSHPIRVRGLKPQKPIHHPPRSFRRTLYGCVD